MGLLCKCLEHEMGQAALPVTPTEQPVQQEPTPGVLGALLHEFKTPQAAAHLPEDDNVCVQCRERFLSPEYILTQ